MLCRKTGWRGPGMPPDPTRPWEQSIRAIGIGVHVLIVMHLRAFPTDLTSMGAGPHQLLMPGPTAGE